MYYVLRTRHSVLIHNEMTGVVHPWTGGRYVGWLFTCSLYETWLTPEGTDGTV